MDTKKNSFKKHTWKQQTTTVEGGPVIFFIGEFSPIFDLKQNDFDLCKRFFHGKKKKKNKRNQIRLIFIKK
jgi:hypothetical protein